MMTTVFWWTKSRNSTPPRILGFGSRTVSFWLLLVLWLCEFALVVQPFQEKDSSLLAKKKDCNDNNDAEHCSWDEDNDDDDDDESPPVSADCQLVMAPSSLESEYAGWGVFTLIDRPQRGKPLLFGDVVVHITDPNVTFAPAMHRLVHDYLWSPEETGGYYEGLKVLAAIPGIGMLANGRMGAQHNVIPFVPTVDEGGLTRTKSPGSGAITHYHNQSFYVFRPMKAGDEVYINYGPNWFQERRDRQKLITVEPRRQARSLQWLRHHGRCLDNIRPGRSLNKDAGRGAFAARALPAGSIVAPVPVLAITDRRALDIVREKEDGTTVPLKQLLLNYCLGHKDSSVLLYPYGPGVNLINHGGGKLANVRLRWSKFEPNPIQRNVSLLDLYQWQLPHSVQAPKFLMELVALRDIQPKEELLLDYGADWVAAWMQHLQSWNPDDDKDREPYVPSYVMEDAVKALRLEHELEKVPYADNVFTSCFYRYSDNAAAALNLNQRTHSAVTTFEWKQTRGIFEMTHLRPCKILQRQRDAKGKLMYTVQIQNRFGLAPVERLPPKAVHIVTNVPRHAVRFSDKIYTTDQHLEYAFRHEIGVPDELFPDAWKDLRPPTPADEPPQESAAAAFTVEVNVAAEEETQTF